jgi:hypothetical protein
MLLKPKKKCLMCGAKCDKVYTTLKYRYESDQMGEAYVCEKCTTEYKLDDSVMNDVDNVEGIEYE